jgi:hypothetical protein
MRVTGCPNLKVVELAETIPEFVATSNFVEVVVDTPTLSKSLFYHQ